jgi:rhamnogalacturonyl hydrolase YesR
LHNNFHNKESELYVGRLGSSDPDFMWGCGVMFSALVGATNHDPKWKTLMRGYFEALDGYWDDKVKIPGYEPSPTHGNGNDKYYDDNAWMVITFADAYELTKDARYLRRSIETQKFVMSGWDDQLGGGIWWHERHEAGTKNTCVNAPAAVGALMIARNKPNLAAAMIEDAKKTVVWTNKNLQASNGLFADSIKVANGEVNQAQLTYNSGLMLRANLMLYQQTKEEAYLNEAKRIGVAAVALIDKATGAYRDSVKWSHLMTEADLELYATTGEAYLLERSKKNAAVHYDQFKKDTPRDLLTLASIARELWLLTEAVSVAR